MTPEKIVLKAVQEEISCQDDETQVHIQTCYQYLKDVYQQFGETGQLALELLWAEEQVKPDRSQDDSAYHGHGLEIS